MATISLGYAIAYRLQVHFLSDYLMAYRLRSLIPRSLAPAPHTVSARRDWLIRSVKEMDYRHRELASVLHWWKTIAVSRCEVRSSASEQRSGERKRLAISAL